MSQTIEIKVPDIGDYKDIPVIEVLVKPGDVIEKEQSLLTLESDKATMDVPSPEAGTVKEIKVKAGDTVSEGVLIVILEAAGAAAAPAPQAEQKPAAPAASAAPAAAASAPAPAAQAAAGGSALIEVKVPDIGDYDGVPVIEIAVKVGDMVEKEQSLITLESDKATMDVPSPQAGKVKEIKVKVGDSVGEGALILILEGAAASAPAAATQAAPEAAKPATAAAAPAPAAKDTGATHALAQAPAIVPGAGRR